MERRILSVTTAIFSYLCLVSGVQATAAVAEPADSTAVAASVPEVPEESTVTDLEDFVLVETRKLVQNDGAKLTYNVTEDPEAGSSSILDILRKVPGVTVDAEDNVKVNGESSFKILKNGREDVMFKGDIKTVLKSLPANSIKKIEVISEPGAKYDAEGVGGILNIVTDNSANLSGFMTQASVWANAYNLGANLRGMVKLNKVMLDANVTYNTGKLWQREQSCTGTTDYELPDGSYRMLYEQRTRPAWDYGQANINMSWEPDTLNLVTFSASGFMNDWNPTSQSSRRYVGPDGNDIWRMCRRVDGIGKNLGGNLQASYQHNFGRDDNTLVFSYLYSHAYLDQNQYNRITESSGPVPESPYTYGVTDNRDNGHIFQVDYTNAFNSHHKLETGLKGSINHTDAYNSQHEGASEAEAVPVEGAEMKLDRFRDVYAVYATYTGSYDKVDVTAGARYEFTRMGINYRLGDHQDFTTLLHDLVPNAAVSYNFTPSASLRLAYQMRIGRPGIWAINPYVDRLTPGEISYGNPDLESEKAHNISVSYSNYGGKFGGMAKFTYRHVANAIGDVIFMKDGLLNSTYANIGRDDRYTFELSGDWTIIKNLRWSVYGCVSYVNLRAKSEMLDQHKEGWTMDCNTNVNYMLPCKLRLSAYGGYYTPYMDLQSTGHDGYFYGFGASRNFLKDDALTVALSVLNPFPAKRVSGYSQKGEGVSVNITNKFSQWNVGVQVTFRFGGLKASVKRTAASVEDDGVSEGGKKKD